MTTESFLDANRASWDDRVEGHLVAYGAGAFADDPHAISKIVQDDATAMGPQLPGGTVAGMKLVHLQCHIGLDTLSWARLGADAVGVDFSAEAIRAARDLAARAGVAARFEESSVEGAPSALNDTFDVVYTSVGVLMWRPRLDTWASAIHDLLKPGGVFYVRDSHPVLNALDHDRRTGCSSWRIRTSRPTDPPGTTAGPTTRARTSAPET
ncbi:class I SAM-dependent methyltransferase [Pengzhenrongella sp.]|jgi:2-polyprenyl-3-methyl-5-hydroxy-6-metoxy-1,4-benzoquinol methylase|uniref:class I SAM-dependent methyltransferase n=1 Tax=Pengzhenrongella sp. TaxID=2888820 RepID=UPI002F93B8A8